LKIATFTALIPTVYLLAKKPSHLTSLDWLFIARNIQ